MAVAPASNWTSAWSSGVSGASQKYVDGIRNTQVDVVGRALAAQDRLLAGFNQAVQSGEWARRLGAVGTQGWKAAAEAKAPNYATGATAGRQRFDNFASKAQPVWSQLSAAIDNMPSGGKANALNRVGAWIDGMSQFKQSYTP